MSSTKCEGLSYPTNFFKSRGSVIRMIFLNTGLNKPHFVSDKMIFMDCSLQIKQNIYSIDIFRAHVTINSKSIKKNRKSPIFESLPFLY